MLLIAYYAGGYVAGRLGLVWNTNWTTVGVAVDAAAFDDQIASGFALLAGAHYRRYFLDAQVGYAPFILRQEGVSRWSGYIELGVGWGP